MALRASRYVLLCRLLTDYYIIIIYLIRRKLTVYSIIIIIIINIQCSFLKIKDQSSPNNEKAKFLPFFLFVSFRIFLSAPCSYPFGVRQGVWAGLKPMAQPHSSPFLSFLFCFLLLNQMKILKIIANHRKLTKTGFVTLLLTRIHNKYIISYVLV